MKNKDVIQTIISHHYNVWVGREIQPSTTRDQILWGDGEEECTGIVTTIYASMEVIRKAAQVGANLIICHESLFWNHGDHIDWLEGFDTFRQKSQLLTDNHITVWRDHDYIHAGMDWQGRRVDGIFFGLLKELGWEGYVQGDVSFPLLIEIPELKTGKLAALLMQRLHLNGIKCIGDTDGCSQHIYIPNHMTGKDNDKIEKMETEDIDTILGMECIDYTVGIYTRDAAMLGKNRRILVIGHFNLEEPGMKWFGETWLPTILPKELPIRFISAGDMFRYFTAPSR